MTYRIVSLLFIILLITHESYAASLELRHDHSTDTISVYRVREDKPILTQNVDKKLGVPPHNSKTGKLKPVRPK